MNTLKKTWVWLCRFRKRKGYGVHSPFAYDFIRTVINERGHYYAYDELKPLRKGVRSLSPIAVDKLLFRLANFCQPDLSILIGEGGAMSLKYIQAGCRKVKCQAYKDANLFLSGESSQEKAIGLLYLCNTPNYKVAFEKALSLTAQNSVFVIDNPYSDNEKKAWWRQLEKDKRLGLTFDLYDVGIILFNPTYSKQHYKVNFV